MGKVAGHRAAQKAIKTVPQRDHSRAQNIAAKVEAAKPSVLIALEPDKYVPGLTREVPLPGCCGFVVVLGGTQVAVTVVGDTMTLVSEMGRRVVLRATERSVVVRTEDLP